ncbi:MAG: HIT family protein, partial [Planctomycetes bacterium]|nr:HIT family protein [Planctomycetota bacterium]
MASIFTRIIQGEIPGRFVWKDEHVVAFLTVRPIRPGHTLVVPRKEVDYWIDMEPELANRVLSVSQIVSRAIQNAFEPQKVGLAVVGLEVRHVHLHLVPLKEIDDLNFAKADPNPDPQALDAAAEKIR